MELNSHGPTLHEGHDSERMIMLEKQVSVCWQRGVTGFMFKWTPDLYVRGCSLDIGFFLFFFFFGRALWGKCAVILLVINTMSNGDTPVHTVCFIISFLPPLSLSLSLSRSLSCLKSTSLSHRLSYCRPLLDTTLLWVCFVSLSVM